MCRNLNNGFSRSPHWQQVAAYFVIIYVAYCDFGIIQLSNSQSDSFIFQVCFSSVLLVSIVVSTLLSSIIDPTDKIQIEYQECNRNKKWFDVVKYEMFCEICESHVSDSAKHCKRCNRCVQDFDHHCKWINNCIGASNYRPFFVMISSVTFYSIWQLVQQVRFLVSVHSGENDAAADGSSQVIQIILVYLAGAVTLIVSILVINLTVLHIWLQSKGMTTYQYILKLRDESLAKNKGSLSNRDAIAAVEILPSRLSSLYSKEKSLCEMNKAGENNVSSENSQKNHNEVEQNHFSLSENSVHKNNKNKENSNDCEKQDQGDHLDLSQEGRSSSNDDQRDDHSNNSLEKVLSEELRQSSEFSQEVQKQQQHGNYETRETISPLPYQAKRVHKLSFPPNKENEAIFNQIGMKSYSGQSNVQPTKQQSKNSKVNEQLRYLQVTSSSNYNNHNQEQQLEIIQSRSKPMINRQVNENAVQPNYIQRHHPLTIHLGKTFDPKHSESSMIERIHQDESSFASDQEGIVSTKRQSDAVTQVVRIASKEIHDDLLIFPYGENDVTQIRSPHDLRVDEHTESIDKYHQRQPLSTTSREL